VSVNFCKCVGELPGHSSAGLRQVFVATTREQAAAAAGDLAERWRHSHPKVA
jgi:putative transposase